MEYISRDAFFNSLVSLMVEVGNHQFSDLPNVDWLAVHEQWEAEACRVNECDECGDSIRRLSRMESGNVFCPGCVKTAWWDKEIDEQKGA